MKGFIKQLLREGLETEEIQQYIDIIDMMDKSNPRRDKYIQILRDKYNYNYIPSNDEELIKNANLKDIKNINDFKDFNNYKKYSSKIFRLRNIPLQKSIEGVLSIDTVINILKPFNIQVKEIKNSSNHAQASLDIIEIPKISSIEVVLHELGHVFDYMNNTDMVSKNMTHTITSYGLSIGGEAFAENFVYYFLYPEFLKKYLPEVYDELNNKIGNNWKLLANKLIDSIQY